MRWNAHSKWRSIFRAVRLGASGPFPSSYLFAGPLTRVLRGNNPGKECKSSQAPQRNPHLYTEDAQTMPSEFYFSQCETTNINGRDVYLFDTSAPKMTGFVHSLFYESLENRRTSTNRYPQPNSESHPTERFKNGIQPNTFVSAGMHPILDNEADVAAFYSINDGYYEVSFFQTQSNKLCSIAIRGKCVRLPGIPGVGQRRNIRL